MGRLLAQLGIRLRLHGENPAYLGVPGERVGVHRHEPEQDPGIIGHGQPAGNPLQYIKAGHLPVPVDDLIQPSLADAGGGGGRAWLTPACFCARLGKVPAARSRSACRISGLRHSRSGMRSARVSASTIRAAREMITMDGFTAPARRLVPDELEQVMRLARFRQAHPGVMVGAGRGWWHAVIPQTNASR